MNDTFAGADAGAQDHSDVVVALVDVLGARTNCVQRALEIVVGLRQITDEAKRSTEADVRALETNTGRTYGQVDVRMAGDAIMVLWYGGTAGPAERVNVAGLWLQEMFLDALGYRLLLRGALGFGSIVMDDLSALGPGMTDAAAFYGRADWAGVVASDRCAELIRQRAVDAPQISPSGFFVEYPVPQRCGRSKRQLALAWPDTLIHAPRASGGQGRSWLQRVLDRLDGPDAGRKCSNTMDFFDWYADEWYDKAHKAMRRHQATGGQGDGE